MSSDASPDALLVEIEDGIAVLRLNRPDAGNALDLELARSFHRAVRRISEPELGVRVVVLAATGRMFCAGGDVRAMASVPDRTAFLDELAGEMHEALLRLSELPIPVVASVSGAAAGGGLGLVLAADIALASHSARFTVAYTRIGLSPDCGVSYLLPRAVGPRRAAVMALTNRTLDAAEAVEWGLVSQAWPDDQLAARTRELARSLADSPGDGAGETARLLRRHGGRSRAEQMADELGTIARLAGSPAASELIAGFGR